MWEVICLAKHKTPTLGGRAQSLSYSGWDPGVNLRRVGAGHLQLSTWSEVGARQKYLVGGSVMSQRAGNYSGTESA